MNTLRHGCRAKSGRNAKKYMNSAFKELMST
jgi:hypothetical protein